jgi:hypothetical protein
MSRSRVAPLRPLSIPKLELEAAVMGSRLSVTIKGSHDYKIEETHFWTDSSTVMSWIKSEARNFQTFVANRIGEIEETTNGAQWHWLPRDENVADEATRDSKPCDFTPSVRWFNGSDFLRLPPDQWPKERPSPPKTEDLEIRSETIGVTTVPTPLVDFNRFGSFKKLVRTIAWIKRLLNKKLDRPSSLILSPSEVSSAEFTLWKLVQRESYPEELRKLTDGAPVDKSSRLHQLSAFLHEDTLIRMKGRTEASPNMPFDSKCPIIWDPYHHVTRLMLLWTHKKLHH